jgi:hypothetical protein
MKICSTFLSDNIDLMNPGVVNSLFPILGKDRMEKIVYPRIDKNIFEGDTVYLADILDHDLHYP